MSCLVACMNNDELFAGVAGTDVFDIKFEIGSEINHDITLYLCHYLFRAPSLFPGAL